MSKLLLAAFVALSAAASPIGSGWPEEAVVGADRAVLEQMGAQHLPMGLEVRGPPPSDDVAGEKDSLHACVQLHAKAEARNAAALALTAGSPWQLYIQPMVLRARNES
jgi:hypothetical protein